MGSEAPLGVTGDTSRDGAETSLSREFVDEYCGFCSKGAMLPPLLGPLRTSTRARVYCSGAGSVAIQFGTTAGHETSVWTTMDGLDALINDLMAVKVRAEIEATT